MRGEKTCRFQPFHLLVSYSTYRSLQSCALIKSLHLYRCCAYEYSLEMNVLLLRRRACPALAKSWQRRREHVSVILGSNVLDFDKLRAVELHTASNKTSTCYARYIEERCSKDAPRRYFRPCLHFHGWWQSVPLQVLQVTISHSLYVNPHESLKYTLPHIPQPAPPCVTGT